jgi:hypothetical protein
VKESSVHSAIPSRGRKKKEERGKKKWKVETRKRREGRGGGTRNRATPLY